MKKQIIIFLIAFLIAGLFVSQQIKAQSPPQKMSYQAVIRDANNVLIASTTVGMQISILQGTGMNPISVYVETQTPTSNINGLVSFEVGTGTVISGTFSTIDWANGPFYIKTETDPAGGANYTITGTSQLLSVPYALYTTETDPAFTSWNKDYTVLNNKPTTISTAQANEIAINTLKVGVTLGTSPGQIQYWNGTAWLTVASGNSGQTLSIFNGVPVWVGTPLVNVVYNPTTGKIWMDRNLGATQIATSRTDEAAYGDLYQWGRGSDGHQISTSATTATLSSSDIPGHGNFILASDPGDWRSPKNDNLWQGVNGTNNPCPAGYRIPTGSELDAERLTWISNDAAGAFASPLKLPSSGFRYSNDGLNNWPGNRGGYWSSTVVGTNSLSLYFGSTSNSSSMYGQFRANAYSVRCIKD